MRKLVLGVIGSTLHVGNLAANATPIVAIGWALSAISTIATILARGCATGSTSDGANTQVFWGSAHSNRDFVNSSTLMARDLSIDADTDNGGGLGIAIARLDWYNSATRAVSDLADFAIRCTFSLNFAISRFATR